jgi:drug/metabolite transporter (DMT)-like permease
MGKVVFSGGKLLGVRSIASLDPLILSQMRTTMAVLVLAPLLIVFGGREAFRIGRRDFLRCIVLGIFGLAASNFFYYFAISQTSVSISIIVQYTAPAWVLLYMVLRGRERPTPVRVLAVAAAVIGCALAIGLIGQNGVKLNWLGVAAALGAAFSFSFYNIYGRMLLLEHDRWKVMLYAMLGAALFWLAVHSPAKILAAHYSEGQWIFMFIFSMTSMLVPFAFYFAGLRYLDPTRAIVTSCLEPVFTVLIAAIFLGEIFGPLQSVGMAMVLAASVLVQLPSREGT